MRRDQADFQASFKRHLLTEQRRAILEMLARQEVDQQVTVGDVLAAAERLGWGDPMSELSLQELAEALLPPVEMPARGATRGASESVSHDDEDVDDVDDDDVADDEADEDQLELQLPRGRGSKKAGKSKAGRPAKKASKKAAPAAKPGKKAGKKAAAAAKAGKKKAGKKAGKAEAAKPEPTAKAGKKAGKKRAKPNARLRSLLRKLDADEPMSLEEAAEVLIPVVEEYGEATMQQLEEATGIGRRKLRFHIGQLVRHEYLERHGMGRGTCYTVSE